MTNDSRYFATHIRFVPLLICLALMGCGQGAYDALLSERSEQLENPHKYGILMWQEHVNKDMQYTVSMPKGIEEVKIEEGEGVQTEVRDVEFGSTRYQMRFSKYVDPTDSGAFANAVEQQYRQLGYEDIPEEEVETAIDSPSSTVKSLNLRHPDRGNARVEVVKFDDRSVASMAVLGPELDEANCGKFFKSASASLRRSRRRRR